MWYITPNQQEKSYESKAHDPITRGSLIRCCDPHQFILEEGLEKNEVE